MTRNQIRILRSSIYYFITFGLLIGIGVSYYSFGHSMFETHNSPDLSSALAAMHRVNIFLYAGFAYWIGLFILNRVKTKMELTEEECGAVSETTVQLNNKFNSWRFVLSILLFLSVFVIILFPSVSAVSKEYGWTRAIEGLFAVVSILYWFIWIFVGLGIALILVTHLKSIHNEYSIDGDTLIIREYSFRHLEAELRIPVKTIDEVSIKGYYGLRPRVIIRTQGITRQLATTTFPEELAVEILKRQ